MKLFALNARNGPAAAAARILGVALARHEAREFEDGEFKVRSLDSVRGQQVFVWYSLHGEADLSAADKLCRLLFLLGSLKDAGASETLCIVPYLAFARKDRRTKAHDPITTRYVAALFEAVGGDGIVTMDVHHVAAFENAFRCPTVHLEARPLFVSHLVPVLRDREVAVVSPDAGGAKRADLLRESLASALGTAIPLAFLEKRRSGGVIRGQDTVVGGVEGRAVVIVDDLVSTGTTLAGAAAACRAQGATTFYAVVTHGLFTGDAERVLAGAGFERLVITNTVPPFRLRPQTVDAHLAVLDVAPLLAEAIRRLHRDEPLEDLKVFGLPQARASV